VSVQPHIFEVGKQYRVLQSLTVGPSSFEAGETLVFELDGYVPYDGSYAYQFHDQKSGETKNWLLHESKPIDTWKTFFLRVD
jgi:hypothetical protein